MLFNSIDFAFFLPIVFCLYWFVFSKNLKAQNMLLLFASYVFYAWWDWRFCGLILFSTVVDFYIGKEIYNTKKKYIRIRLLIISLISNLGLLFFFKYYGFFVDSFIDAFSFFSYKIQPNSLNIILPVGISFYTFQTLSYTIDIYRSKLKPTNNFIAFSVFISFFPQLVAGPIERATHLLPQFLKGRIFNYNKAVDGMRQILWGLFKKIVIANNCAIYVNDIFTNYNEYSGSVLLIGVVFFSFQIYGDFSGYSDIAIGTSRLFGFNLKQNFAFPYFSRDIAQFWRRWHISLSTWFRDYLYIPLGGSRVNLILQIRNVFIIFLVSGFWHGANWTFIFWGFLHACYFIPILITGNNRKNIEMKKFKSFVPAVKEIVSVLWTFTLVSIAWVFFRADSISHAFAYLSSMFDFSILSYPYFHKDELIKPIFIFISFFMLVEFYGRFGNHALEFLKDSRYRLLRYVLYYFLIITIIWYSGNKQEFIYFNF